MRRLTKKEHEHHRRRIRRHSHNVSLIGAPAIFVTVTLWLTLRAIVCWGGSPSHFDVFSCENANFLPDLAGLFTLVAFGFLIFALDDYGEKIRRVKHKPRKRLFRLRHHAKNIRTSYRRLDKEHRSIVIFAFEMAGWSAATVIVILLFYQLEYTVPLALFLAIALARVAYALLRRFIAMIRNIGGGGKPRKGGGQRKAHKGKGGGGGELAGHRPTSQPLKPATKRPNLSSSQIDRVPLKVSKGAVIERALVGGAQHHARRASRFERLLPARRAQAPAVAGLEAGEAESRQRRRQVVAARFGEFQEFGCRDHAHRMAADILRPGIAAAVAVEPGHRLDRTGFEWASQHVERRRPPAFAAGTRIQGHRAHPPEGCFFIRNSRPSFTIGLPS